MQFTPPPLTSLWDKESIKSLQREMKLMSVCVQTNKDEVDRKRLLFAASESELTAIN